MSTLIGSNRFFPRAGEGGGGVVPPGAGLWTLYGGTVVGLTTLTETVAIGSATMLSSEKLLAIGGISADDSTGLASWLQTGAGSASPVSDPGTMRFRYDETTATAEISINGGGYAPLGVGGASPWTAGGGLITEVNPANLVVVGSGVALGAQQFQVLGDSLLRPALDSIATFEVQDSATTTRFQVDTVNNAAVVTGSYQMIGPAAEIYLESQASTAPNAAVNQGRIRYNNVGTPSWQGSVNGGAYFDFITSNTIAGTAFVDGGNSFGAVATLGTNDTNDLVFRTDSLTRGAITSAGIWLINSAGAVSVEQLAVGGGIAANPVGVSQNAFLAFGDGALAGVSTANAGRFRYNGGVAQVSLNTGAYVDLITSGSLAGTAFVDGGNSFVGDATLGTNNNFALAFETFNTERARFTNGGLFLVNTAVALGAQQVQVLGNSLVRASVNSTATFEVQDAATGTLFTVDTTNSRSVIAGSSRVAGGGAVTFFESTASTAAVSALNEGRIRYNNVGTPSWQGSVNGGAYFDFITSNTIAGTAFVDGGNTFAGGGDATLGTNNNVALLFETNNTTRGRFLNTGEFLVAAAAVAGTESMRVSGGGALVDGTQFSASVTGALALNSSGAAINVGNNADAFAINVGTGASARTITIGNVTGATSVVLNAGTGNIDIGTTGQARATRIATGAAAQTVTVGSTNGASSMTIDAGTGTIGIGTSASARTTNIATGAAAQTVTVGSTNGASSMTIDAGTGTANFVNSAHARTVNIATGAAVQTVSIGSQNSTSTTTINAGTGYIRLAQRTEVRNASGLYVLDGGGTNGVSIVQQSGTTHTLAGVGTTTTFRTSTILELNNNVTALTDGSPTIGTEANRVSTVTTTRTAVKTHTGYSGSQAFEVTGSVQTTSGTATTIFTLTLDDNSGYWIEAWVVGRDTASGNRHQIARGGLGQRQAAGGAAQTSTVFSDNNNGLPASLLFTPSGNDILIQVQFTGAGTPTINWVGTIRYQRVVGT